MCVQTKAGLQLHHETLNTIPSRIILEVYIYLYVYCIIYKSPLSLNNLSLLYYNMTHMVTYVSIHSLLIHGRINAMQYILNANCI